MEAEQDGDKNEYALGIGDSSSVNPDDEVSSQKEEAPEGPTEVASTIEAQKKGLSLSSSLRNLVRGRSKTRNKDEKKEDTEISSTTGEKEEPVGDTKLSFYKMLQNVSSSIQRTRSSSVSSTNMRDASAERLGETAKTGFRIFRRSASRSELESAEETALESGGGKSGTLGRFFGRRSPSKPELLYEGSQEALGAQRKGGTLGRLFSRRSSSKVDIVDSDIPDELKSASLGRRIGSTLRGALGKKDPPKAQESPQ